MKVAEIACSNTIYMNRVMRKPTIWFPTRSDTNQAVQLQKMARGLKFWIKKEEGLYYPCSENKGADQLRGLICDFVFAYAKHWFSHIAAHILFWTMIIYYNYQTIQDGAKNEVLSGRKPTDVDDAPLPIHVI